MRKEVKDTIVVELGQKLKEYAHFYLVDIAGLNAADTSDLRRKCFKNDVKLIVVKNTLLHKVFEASEIDFEPLYGALKGNTALMFTNTANVPAKLLKEYKDNKKEIPALKAAYAEESIFVGADKLEALVNIKSREELIGQIIGMLQSPVQNVISALQNAGGQTIAGVLKTMEEKKN